MAMTIDQARAAISTTNPSAPVTAQQAGPGDNPFGGGAGDGGTGGTNGSTALIQGPGFDDSGGYQTDLPPGYQPIVGFPGYFYNPDTGDIRIATNYTNASAKDANGNPITGTPSVTTRSLTAAEKKAFIDNYNQFAQQQNGGPGSPGSPGSGTDVTYTPYQQAQIGYDYAQLAQNQAQFDKTFGLNQQQQNQAEVGNRASSGLTLADLERNLANDQYQRALDPGNYPAYLAAQAGMPQGSGSPISNLLGSGTQIVSPEGANPLADPRFQNLISQLYGYAQPQSLQTVQNIAAQNGGTLPQSFYDYTQTQNTSVPAHATGGTQTLHEPVIGIGLHSGQPKFLAGEAGAEKLTFEPVHSHSNGGMPVPHSHTNGLTSHEHLPGGVVKYADGGAAVTGASVDGTLGGSQPGGFTHHQLVAAYNAYHPNAPMADDIYTPAEGSAISLGKALQPLGYAPQNVVQQLMQGRAPTPGSLNEQFLARLPASLRALLGSTVQSFLGNSGLQDFNSALAQYAMPGQSANTSASYA